MELIIEGVLAIQAGSNPRVIAQKLNSMVGPAAGEEREVA
jgi:chemotaxis protein MotA